VAGVVSVVASAVVFIGGIRQQLQDAIDSERATDDILAEMIAELAGAETTLAAAIAENTGAADDELDDDGNPLEPIDTEAGIDPSTDDDDLV
jgi:hypothetical protein